MLRPAVLLLSVAVLLSGCGLFGPAQPDPSTVEELSKLAYPAQAKLGADLDILAVVQGSWLQLVNRTPRHYGALQLWLNQQWVGQVPAVRIGTDNEYDLSRFVNEFGEPYPSGDLLHPERALPLVLAELYDPATTLRHRLVVRKTGL